MFVIERCDDSMQRANERKTINDRSIAAMWQDFMLFVSDFIHFLDYHANDDNCKQMKLLLRPDINYVMP